MSLRQGSPATETKKKGRFQELFFIFMFRHQENHSVSSHEITKARDG